MINRGNRSARRKLVPVPNCSPQIPHNLTWARTRAAKMGSKRLNGTAYRQSAHRWRLGCQPYAPATLYPQKHFLVLISVRGWVNPRVIVRLEGLSKLKNINDLIGTQTCDLRDCIIAPQQLRYRAVLMSTGRICKKIWKTDTGPTFGTRTWFSRKSQLV
jgi:hypothetical protein